MQSCRRREAAAHRNARWITEIFTQFALAMAIGVLSRSTPCW